MKSSQGGSVAVLAIIIVLLVAGGVGGFFYVTKKNVTLAPEGSKPDGAEDTPQIIILEPKQNAILEYGQSYSLRIRWATKHISSSEDVQIYYTFNQLEGSGENGLTQPGETGYTTPVKNTGDTMLTLSPDIIKDPGNYLIGVQYEKFSHYNQMGLPIYDTFREEVPVKIAGTLSEDVVATRKNRLLKSLLMDFKGYAYIEHDKSKNVSLLCKNGEINTEISTLRVIADNIIKKSIGSFDQTSAGIKCLSDRDSFALSVKLNQTEKETGSICASMSVSPETILGHYVSYKIDTVKGVAFNQKEYIGNFGIQCK